jgi:periplasmic nitrate reductase NapE
MDNTTPNTQPSKARELRLVLLLAMVVLPLLTVAVVGAYGFAVWMLQLVFGPPSV